MTWEELKEKAKELGWECIKEKGVEQLYKDFEGCRINFIKTSGNVVVDIRFPLTVYSGILWERISADKMYQIMLALR
ncbi:MAG: hypothetical protein IJ077_08620 [Eubacterium sp.]|nr:hypothetical protein [Alphaproteobacteria bacterium]MBQ8981656.1 hypothetical protein [Eubacterium sp.]